MKKNLKSEKLTLSQKTIRRLTDERLATAAGASASGCLITSTCYTKQTTTLNGCQ